MMTPRRWVLVGALLATTIAAGWTAVRDKDAESGVPARAQDVVAATPALRTSPPEKLVVHVDKMERTPDTSVERDPFSGSGANTLAARKPSSRRAAPPAIPFVYAGRYETGGEAAVFLTSGDRNLVVREGDLLDDAWRVDRIDPGAIAFTYLPLGERHLIVIPEPTQ